MKRIAALVLAAGLALAGCSTAPQPQPVVAAAVPKAEPIPYRWTNGNAEKAHKAMVATFGRGALPPGSYLWLDKMPEGDSKIVVDLVSQLTYVFRGDQLVGVSTISSGSRDRETPLGFWKVLEKKKMHRSRKYDNAPMPFMQRIDDHGIALHGGALPGFPASHGCVRLPMKFAEKLYGLTKLGTEVIIEG